jgi:hypothetical protein
MGAGCVSFCPAVNSNKAAALLQLDSHGQPLVVWPGRVPLGNSVAGEQEVGQGAGGAAPRADKAHGDTMWRGTGVPDRCAAPTRPRRTEVERQAAGWCSRTRSGRRSWRGDVGLVATWGLRSEGRRWRGGDVIRWEQRRELPSLLDRRSAGPQAAISGVEGRWLPAGRSGAGPEVRPGLARGVSAARAARSWRTATGERSRSRSWPLSRR